MVVEAVGKAVSPAFWNLITNVVANIRSRLMAKQTGNGRSVGSARIPSSGAAVLDLPELDEQEAQRKDLLQDEIIRVATALQQGRLAERARVDLFEGSDRAVIESLNLMLDSVIKPLNMSAEYMDRISKGDIPPRITDAYNGDFNEIKNNLNVCIDALSRLVADGAGLTQSMLEGKLAVRADATKHQGDFKKIIEGFNLTLDNIIRPLNVSAEYVDRISKGDIPPKITDTYNGDFNEIKNNLNNCIDNINALVNETAGLIKASAEGKLATRADAAKHQGDYRKIVAGVNEMLDAILLPIGEGNRVLAQISAGKIDELIAQTYKGDHEKMKEAVNHVALVLQTLQKELARFTQASHHGQLSERGKPDQFQGAYAGIVAGVNEMLDAILLPIGEGNRVLAQISAGKIDELIAQTYKGDHEKMKEAVNHVALVLQTLQKELARLTQASHHGQLSERGKPDQFQGAYAGIVQGVNEMLDAILLPIGEGNRVLAQISAGKIDELIAQTYKGDHEKMKEAVNHVALVLQTLQKELARLTQASHDGQLSERGKPDQFQGAYAGIVQGVNEMLDAILLPIGEGNRVLRLIRGGNLREKVEIACKGDHEKMKLAINGVHDWLTALVAYVTKIANGDMTATVDKASSDDQIHEWLMLLNNNISGLADDVNTLAQSSASGRLGVRADASKHRGEYRKIVEGFNKTLDIVVDPLKVAASQASALASSAEELTAVSNQMASNAEETATQANVVSAASEQVSK